MIPLILLYLHVLGAAAAFTTEYQKDGTAAGLLSVGFFVLIFSVGWSISSFILRYVMEAPGFGSWLDRDALSLVVLTIGEALFYYFYFSDRSKHSAAL